MRERRRGLEPAERVRMREGVDAMANVGGCGCGNGAVSWIHQSDECGNVTASDFAIGAACRT